VKNKFCISWVLVSALLIISCSTSSTDSNQQLRSVKKITSFSINSLSVIGVIDEAAKEIFVTFKSESDITALSPTILFDGVSITPNSGVVQDFTNPLLFSVYAEDGSSQVYSIKVNIIKNKILYINNGSIYTMDYDGSNKITIYQQVGTDYCNYLSYNKITNKIAFTVDHNKQYRNIMTINIDGTGLDNITDTITIGQNYSTPSFSPDGNNIVYSYCDTSNGLYIMDSSGSNKELLVSFSGLDWYASPFYSITGTKIFFINEYNKSYSNIFSINPDGSSLLNLTNNLIANTLYSGLSLTNETDSLLVVKRDNNSGNRICTISTTGINESIIVESVSPNWFYNPSIYPKDNKLLFIDDYNKEYTNIKTIDSSGLNIQNLTNTTTAGNNFSYPLIYEIVEEI
jgi:hypothetical protein